jgi:hypothetical protein
MAQAQLPKPSFASGEIAKRLHGHFDYKLHNTGLALCENYVISEAGGATRRPPTEIVAQALNVTGELPKSILIDHQIARDDAFVIEAAHLTARFFRDAALLLSGPAPYTITHPFTTGDLGKLRWQTSGDVVFLSARSRGMWKLTRRGNIDWVSEAWVPKQYPYLTENADRTKTLKVSLRAAGAVLLQTYGWTLDASYEGVTFKLRDGDQRTIKEWLSDEGSVNLGEMRRYNERIYVSMTGGTAGGVVPPVHEEGDWVSDGGTRWRFVRFGFGLVRIDTVTSPTSADATNLGQVPEEFSDEFTGVYGTTEGSWRWAEQAFSTRRGWPREINIHKQRMWLYGPNHYYASVLSAYDDWTEASNKPDSAFSGLLGSDTGKANDVQWAASGKTLVIGTSGEEYSISGATLKEGLSATSINIDLATNEGSWPTRPVKAGPLLHVAADGRRLQEISYDFQTDSFVSKNRAITAEHITAPSVARPVWHRDPRRVVWLRRGDGILVGFTYNLEHEVFAWHRHPGDWVIQDMAVIPSPDGGHEDLWLRVKRTINGADKYFIERMLPFFDPAIVTDLKTQPYLDCQATYDGGPATLIHVPNLPNTLVGVVTDQGYQGKKMTDAAGDLTLAVPSVRVTVGLNYRSLIRLLPSNIPLNDGSPEGRRRMSKAVKLRAIGGPGGFIGNVGQPNLAERILKPEGVTDQSVPIIERVEEAPVDGEWSDEDYIDIWTDEPWALDILAADRDIETGDA